MKIVHMADLHLGKFYKGLYDLDFANSRKEELWKSFENNISYIEKNDMDILLLSGDIYERDYFTNADLNRFKLLLNSLTKTEVFIIAGNHDYIDENSPILNTDFNKNVHIFDNQDFFQIDRLNLRVYGQSWKSKYDFNAKLDYKLDPSYINILLLHASTISGEKYYISKDELENLEFDYIALGHIHLRQKITDSAYYPGSPEPLSFKDLDEHGFIELNLDENKDFEIKYITNSLRKYINNRIEITSDQSIYEIKDLIIKKLQGQEEDFNRIYIYGNYRDSAYLIKYLEDNLSYYYIEIIDKTEEDIDIEKIYSENKNNLLGKFIAAASSDEKVLKYGLRALMEARDEN